MSEKSSDVGELATKLASKNPLVIKIKIIVGVVLAVFLILVAILNYSGGKFVSSSASISSDMFTKTEITPNDYIYNYKHLNQITTDEAYFLLECETDENVTLTIEIYSYEDSFEIPIDENNNFVLPDFTSFNQLFSKTIDFIHEDTENLSDEEIEELANKYKHSIEIDFNPESTIIVYVKNEESFDINKLSFIFEKSVE